MKPIPRNTKAREIVRPIVAPVRLSPEDDEPDEDEEPPEDDEAEEDNEDDVADATVIDTVTVRSLPAGSVPLTVMLWAPKAVPAGMLKTPLAAPDASAVIVPSVTGSECRTAVNVARARQPDVVRVKLPPGATVVGETEADGPAVVVVVTPDAVVEVD